MTGPERRDDPKALLNRLVEPERPLDSSRGDIARAGHIDVRRKANARFAFAYTHLLWVFFNGSDKLQLHFSTHTVTLVGRNLASLYERVLRHEVTVIEPVDERHDTGEGDEPVVNSVGVMQKPGPGDGTQAGDPDEA